MVKVTLVNEVKPEAVDESFVGLVNDREGEIWLFGDDFASTLQDSAALCACKRSVAIRDWGPFTKYNGQVIIEND